MASVSAQVDVTTEATLLWQTTTGVPPDSAPDAAAQVFRAGTFNDPLPIVVKNTDAENSVYLGGSDVSAENGFPLDHGESLTFNSVGGDSLFAISAGSVVVAVLVGRQ